MTLSIVSQCDLSAQSNLPKLSGVRSTSIQAHAQRTLDTRASFLVTLFAAAIFGLSPHFLFGQASQALWQKEHSKVEKIAQFTAKEHAAILFSIEDGALGYANGGTVRKLDLKGGSAQCPWPDPEVSHDGRFLAHLSDGGSGGCAIQILELATGREWTLAELQFAPPGVSWSWDDSEIAFFDLRSPLPSIQAVSLRGGSVRVLVPQSQLRIDETSSGVRFRLDDRFSLQWSHSGREMLVDFSRDEPTQQANVYSAYPMVVRIDLANGNSIFELGDGEGAVVSPLADRIAWYRGNKIVAANIDGSDRQVLTGAPRWLGIFSGDFKGPLVWAPDGNRMFFGVWESETCKDDVYLLSADTRHAKRFLRGTCITILSWR